MPAVRTLPWVKDRQPRVVPYEQVIDLDINPAPPPPPSRPDSMAHVVSQTQQPPQPPLPYSHPSYQHYPPPNYPYPPPPHQHQAHHHPHPQPHPQYPYHPPPYAQYPPNGYYPPAPPASRPPQQPQPPPPTAAAAAANPTPPAAGPPQHLQWQSPATGTGNSQQPAQQEGDPPITVPPRDRNTEDDDTKLVRCALRWTFVRVPGVSHTLFWDDVAKSFERIRGRHYATCKRKMEVLERNWRVWFAARDAQGGLRGNNNTDLARAMRSWITFRDDEERQNEEKEDDIKALEVRRRRLHELETERLGLTDVCRYETRVVVEDEEIGPRGIEVNERQPADGDDSNPILLDDEPNAEPPHQTITDPLENLEPPKPNEQPNAADQIAPIVELLRKRQLEEREEADIRREEQVLLNKRLAMMEEQVQMLARLITQHHPPLASPSPQVDVAMDKSKEFSAVPEMEAEIAVTRQAAHDTIVIDDDSAGSALEHRSNASLASIATAGPVDANANLHIEDEVAMIPAGEPPDTTLEPGTSAVFVNKAAASPADVSMGNSTDSPEEP